MTVYAGPAGVTNGLVFHVDAGNTKSYPGSGTTWYDLSGNGNNATLSGNYSYSSGKFTLNAGANGDGTGRASVTFGSMVCQPTFRNVFRANRFMSVPIFTNMALQIFSSGRTAGYYDRALYMAHNSIGPGEVTTACPSFYHVGFSDPSPAVLSLTVGPIMDLTAVYANANVYFYLNGVLFYSPTHTATTLNLSGDWHMSNQPVGVDNGFDSDWYVSQVYNRVLTADEIMQNYQALRGRLGI